MSRIYVRIHVHQILMTRHQLERPIEKQSRHIDIPVSSAYNHSWPLTIFFFPFQDLHCIFTVKNSNSVKEFAMHFIFNLFAMFSLIKSSARVRAFELCDLFTSSARLWRLTIIFFYCFSMHNVQSTDVCSNKFGLKSNQSFCLALNE